MAKTKSITAFLDELTWRGLVENQTPGFKERLSKGPITGYVGFDPTGRSLQVGNLIPVMLLAHLQRAGGKPLVVVGGGTGMIGDPSGRSAERPLLDEDTLRENTERQRRQLERFLDFGTGATDAELVDNLTWLSPLNLLAFLRDTGKHFTLSYMLQKESVKSRLEEGISYTEFSYMLLQAYDFLHLYREKRCELQLGGSDQWGNITAGRELIRRVDGGEAHGLTAPLLTTPSGGKFGKSEEGAVWLDPELTTPYRFYQFWVNADDRDVQTYFRALSFRARDEISDLMEQHAGNTAARIPHKALAAEVTERVHGKHAAASATGASQVMFGELDPREADAGTWETLVNELPSGEIALKGDVSAVDLVAGSSLAKSKSEARRLLQQGGISVNGEPLTPEGAVGPDRLLAGRYLWLRRGKKADFIFTAST
jgi:tyrosyl-tRNA synthetase